MKQGLLKSTIFRIIAIIIVLVLPINILTLLLSEIVLQKNREQISKEIQSTLDVNANHFNDTLARVSRSLIYLSIEESDVIALANVDKDASANEIGSYLAGVKQHVENEKSSVDLIDMVYFYFPKVDYTVCAGYPGIPFKACQQFIRETAAASAAQDYKWSVRQIDGLNMLFGFHTWNNSNYGIMVNLERLLNKLDLSSVTQGRTVFFARTNGTPLTSAGSTFLGDVNMSLEELGESKRYEVYRAAVEQSDMMLVEIVDWNAQTENLPFTITLLQGMSVLMTLIVIPLLLLYLRKWVIRPLNRLTKAINRIEQGDIDYRIHSIHEGREFDKINQSFNEMMDQVKQLKIDNYDKELEKKNIQMRYLSQQIQPHFILNAMNIIYSYEPEEYPLIQRMVACIAKYFRYIVKMNADFVTLQQEMEHISNYFEIQKARFPDLFHPVVAYEDVLANALIPPLLIQNFAENAIKHSLQAGKKITILLKAECIGADAQGKLQMRILLTDTGAGMSDALIEKIERFKATGQAQEGLGVGIQNSIERMEHLYQAAGSIHFRKNSDGPGTTVEMILPVFYDAQSNGEAAT